MSPSRITHAVHRWISAGSLGVIGLAVASISFGQTSSPVAAEAKPAAKTLMDDFLPMPIHGIPLSKDAWGAPNVLPRDPQNGLEDPTIKQYNYWDGQIIKGPDGKYHLFASRWDAAKGHNGGWGGSVAVQAVSDNLFGPYTEKGLLWPDNQGGKGHNVTALVMPDGNYAVVVSETRPGDVFVSKSLDGPWTQLGSIQVATQRKWRASNYSIMVRPDGDFEIVPRSGQILISKNGILGPYQIMGASVYPKTAPDGTPLRNMEDPVVWYSGGLYHIVVNNWSTRKAYHLTSKDGVTNWKFQGLAYDPSADFVRYTDGTVNHWNNLERPGAYIENGHVVAFTFAVIDVPKNADRTNDGHGSKVIVVPFAGATLDADLQKDPANFAAPATPAPAVTPPDTSNPSVQAPLPVANKAASGPPLLGWSSWSNTWRNGAGQPNEAYVKAQADVMAAKLKSSGYLYINLDDGWAQGFDEHGRLQPDLHKFPGGIAGLAAYVHGQGLKLGIYLTPGLRIEAWQGNGTVAGTNISLRDIADPTQNGCTQGKTPGKCYHIDFTKPGAVEYVQSYADLLASWGVDYIKMDFVGPGGGNTKADTREDIKQWQAALKKTGRPIWLELSNSLSFSNIDVWKANANGWRIEGDVENYGKDGKLTRWSKVALRFKDAPQWAAFAGPSGWNDLDSLEIGNGDSDGLTPDERRSAMTLWAISCSPLILGADLTKLDDDDLKLLTNPEVLAIDQAGHPATPLDQKTGQQVWRVKNADGSYTVAFFNLDAAPAKVEVKWSDLGLAGGATVRDLWARQDLGKFPDAYSTLLAPHASALLQVCN